MPPGGGLRRSLTTGLRKVSLPGGCAAAGQRWRQPLAGAGASLLVQGALLGLVLAWGGRGPVPGGRPAAPLAVFALPASPAPPPPRATARPPAGGGPRAVVAPALPRALPRAVGPGLAMPAGQTAPPAPTPALAPVPAAGPPQPDPAPPRAAPAKADSPAPPADYAHRVWLRIMACRPAGIPLAGRVTLRFDLDASGQVSGAMVLRPSGIALLDRAALQALHRAAPFPLPPAGAGGAAGDAGGAPGLLHFEVDVHFGSAA